MIQIIPSHVNDLWWDAAAVTSVFQLTDAPCQPVAPERV